MKEKMETSLRPSSIPGEFYLGDKPGTLQYKKSTDEIIRAVSLMRDHDIENEFVICDHSVDNIARSIPHTRSKEWMRGKWQIILIMKKEIGDVIWLKSAMRNRETGEIALLTSTNSKEQLKKPIKTMKEGWFVGHYRMSAPMSYWRELKNRILYSL